MKTMERITLRTLTALKLISVEKILTRILILSFRFRA